jgi:hypothetical protein
VRAADEFRFLLGQETKQDLSRRFVGLGRKAFAKMLDVQPRYFPVH